MLKITIVGAGGYVFPLTMIRDVLAFPALQDSTFALMDVDPEGLQRTAAYARRLIETHRLPTKVETTTDRRRALEGADFVIVTFQVGGLEAYRLDMEIPRKYGLDQTVGDTLGPGGIFRGLRSIAVLDGLARDMREVCPSALLIQYANPMSINCWFTAEAGIETVGLCHSVQHTSQMLARVAGLQEGAWSFKCAGINHQAWFIEFTENGRDVLPRIREAMNQFARSVEISPLNESDDLYAGGRERVRTAIMNLTGYFHTESSHHASEYLPYFRKNPEETARWVPQRWDYYEICRNHDYEGQRYQVEELATKPLEASYEYGAYIIDSMVTGTPRVIYGNMQNTGLISNLPVGCNVEVPCIVDRQGVQPVHIGNLPTACATLNWGSIAVQACTVRAAQTGDRNLVHAAVALDKLTSAVVPLDEIHKMVDEMLAAEERWLPQFSSLK